MILKIFQTGYISLRQFAKPLGRDEILSQPIQELIVSMRDTMRDAPGVGLAAPQVGMPFQLAVVEDVLAYIDKLPPGQAAQRNRVAVPFHVIINPSLTVEGTERVPFFEGCLSLAGFTAIVPRALSVRVDCLNERAEPVTIRAKGWYARILQHEIDHLHGRLYIDGMEPGSFTTLDNFNRYWKDKSVADFWSAVRDE
jgi:peptide deformylase